MPAMPTVSAWALLIFCTLLLVSLGAEMVSNDRPLVVMYQGRVVEENDVYSLFTNPRHPYTKALIHCIPRLGQKRRRLASIQAG